MRQAINCCKRVLEAAKLAYANKLKQSITSQKRDSWDFWQITNSVLKKGKPVLFPLLNSLEGLSSPSGKAKLFTKNFSKKSNLGDLGTPLPVFTSRTNLKFVFTSRTNLKLHSISITPKTVKKVITNLNFSKASYPDFILEWWF